MRDVSFRVEPGQTLAIVGHTGAGKTTIIQLLLRFYDIQRGEILLDGVDIRTMELQELRRLFGIVLQDPFLFTGTLSKMTRSEAEALVEQQGGKILGSVSSKLNFLIVGQDAGSKLEKAKKITSIRILTEDAFLDMVSK